MVRKLLSSGIRKLTTLQTGTAVFLATLPDTIIFGTIVFAVLGPDWIGIGILSCFVAHVLARLMSIFIASNVEIVLAPSSYSALVLSSVVVLVISSSETMNASLDPEILSVQTALIVGVVSGFIQLIFYRMQLSKLIQFLPFELISNVVNITAVLIINKQIPILFLKNKIFSIFSLKYSNINFFTMIIGFFCFLPVINRKIFSFILPTPIMSFLWGMLSYNVLVNIIQPGDIEFLPEFSLPDLQNIVVSFDISILPLLTYDAGLLFYLFLAAFSLAILNTLSLLLASKQVQEQFDRSNKNSKDLLANSITNIIAPFLGGIPCTGKIGVTVWALKNGTHGKTIALIVALFYLFLIVSSEKFFQFVPLSVLAGVSIVVAFELFDKKIISIFQKLISLNITSLREDRTFILMFLSMLITALYGNFLIAFMVGFTISLLDFIIKISKYNIKIDNLSDFHSRTHRLASSNEIIRSELSKGILVDIQGFLLFSSAENIGEKIEEFMVESYDVIVLDLRKVYYYDTSGTLIFLQKIKKLQRANLKVYFIISNNKFKEKFLKELQGDFVEGTEKLIFSNLNDLLIKLEVEVLKGKQDSLRSFNKENSEIFDGLSVIQRDKVLSLMEEVEFNVGEYICQIQEPALLLIESGSIDVFRKGKNDTLFSDSTEFKIFRYLQGSIIGDVSFLDGEERSAILKATEHTRCWRLRKSYYDQIKFEEPHLALSLLENVSKSLSVKIRNGNKMMFDQNLY